MTVFDSGVMVSGEKEEPLGEASGGNIMRADFVLVKRSQKSRKDMERLHGERSGLWERADNDILTRENQELKETVKELEGLGQGFRREIPQGAIQGVIGSKRKTTQGQEQSQSQAPPTFSQPEPPLSSSSLSPFPSIFQPPSPAKPSLNLSQALPILSSFTINTPCPLTKAQKARQHQDGEAGIDVDDTKAENEILTKENRELKKNLRELEADVRELKEDLAAQRKKRRKRSREQEGEETATARHEDDESMPMLMSIPSPPPSALPDADHSRLSTLVSVLWAAATPTPASAPLLKRKRTDPEPEPEPTPEAEASAPSPISPNTRLPPRLLTPTPTWAPLKRRQVDSTPPAPRVKDVIATAGPPLDRLFTPPPPLAGERHGGQEEQQHLPRQRAPTPEPKPEPAPKPIDDVQTLPSKQPLVPVRSSVMTMKAIPTSTPGGKSNPQPPPLKARVPAASRATPSSCERSEPNCGASFPPSAAGTVIEPAVPPTPSLSVVKVIQGMSASLSTTPSTPDDNSVIDLTYLDFNKEDEDKEPPKEWEVIVLRDSDDDDGDGGVRVASASGLDYGTGTSREDKEEEEREAEMRPEPSTSMNNDPPRMDVDHETETNPPPHNDGTPLPPITIKSDTPHS
ncbi:hypothetical protein PQX77_022324 [Marasmius sp. AFHP31]|nr:hypothetical protein PQX77_022324 [Marasmius sp. AFHP31]